MVYMHAHRLSIIQGPVNMPIVASYMACVIVSQCLQLIDLMVYMECFFTEYFAINLCMHLNINCQECIGKNVQHIH